MISGCVRETNYICPDKKIVDNPSKCVLSENPTSIMENIEKNSDNVITNKNQEYSQNKTCNNNEIYLEKTNDCYNTKDKISQHQNYKVTTICSYPCQLSESEFSIASIQIKDSYSLVYGVSKLHPRLESEIRVNEKDSVCSQTGVFGWRKTKFGNQLLVICPNRIENNGKLVFPKITIEHELIHSFIHHRIGCNDLNEGLAEYITQFIDSPDFFASCKEIYGKYKSGELTLEYIRAKGWMNSPHMRGCFFFAELNDRTDFRKTELGLLFDGIKDGSDLSCQEMKNVLSSIKDKTVISELYNKYDIQ